MKLTAAKLLPNALLYSDQQDCLVHTPSTSTETLDSLDYSAVTNNLFNQADIKEFLLSWVNELVVIFDTFFRHERVSGRISNEDLNLLADTFNKQLTTFITHTNHGILHSFCVYHGMVYIAQKENIQLADTKMQLLALLHDCIQTIEIPSLDGSILETINQRNEHAEIIALLMQTLGKTFGFQDDEIQELVFALKYHDSTYNGDIITDPRYSILAKILHDSDKLLSATTTPDPHELLRTSLERNLLANDGEVGSYLLRDLEKDYRDKWQYGDRCFCDSITVIRAEIRLHFYTHTAQEISKQRTSALTREVNDIYGTVYDTTFKTLQFLLQPAQRCSLFCIGMDQTPEKITTPPNDSTQLQMLILSLYERVLHLQSINFSERYNIHSDARGWKLKMVLPDTEFILDPSVARFCFTQSGELTTEKRTEFLEAIIQALST